MMTRRGSTESGFFSCLNEDFSTTYKPYCCCSSNETPFDLDDHAKFSICRCLATPATLSSNQTINETSSSGVATLLEETSTTVSSLRSFDDLELSDRKRFHHCRHHHHNVDIDMGLINRLALDSEINSLIQKNHLGNQLLYCKNRTSSIYTDSSDDISSLAGSDSLYWDERSFTTPNARSAQIAKIVEYFERKGQQMRQFKVPDSLKSSTSATATTSPSHVYPPSVRHHLSSASSQFAECFVDFRHHLRHRHDFGGSGSSGGCSSVGGSSSGGSTCSGALAAAAHKLATRSDYEQFCMELDSKKPMLQHRIIVCEGAVRSKLQLFDKVKQENVTEK
jgi:hypothetical protein